MTSLALALLVLQEVPVKKAPVVEAWLNLEAAVQEPGHAPRLRVTVTNPSDQPLELLHFDGDACFAHFQLALALTTPTGAALAPAPCTVKAFPGVRATLGPRAREERVLDLGVVFPSATWDAGEWTLRMAWDTRALAPHFEGRFALTSGSPGVTEVARLSLVTPRAHVHLVKGVATALPGGAKLTLDGHGHKDVGPGQRSPLMVEGHFAPPGQPGQRFWANVDPTPGATFTIDGGGTFRVDRFEYDASMDLTWFGVLASP